MSEPRRPGPLLALAQSPRWRLWRQRTLPWATTMLGILVGCVVLFSQSAIAAHSDQSLLAALGSAMAARPLLTAGTPGNGNRADAPYKSPVFELADAASPSPGTAWQDVIGQAAAVHTQAPPELDASYLRSPFDAASATEPDPSITLTGTATPEPTASPTLTARSGPATATPAVPVFTYTVASGDTLSSIAAQFGVSVRTLTRANGLTEATVLATGRDLLILRRSGLLHTVAEGESVLVLAERYRVIPEEIAATNGLSEPYLIYAGEQLIIPESPDGEPADPASTAGPPTPVVRGKQAYDVVAGDTLSAIGARFGVTVDALAAANGLDAAKPLLVGQHLTIPPLGAVEHVVQKGDTVSSIAALYGASATEIIRANGLYEPYILSLGQALLVPGGIPPRPTPAATPTPTPRPTAVTAVTVYQVVAGDTLSAIATRFGVTVAALATANGLDVTKPLLIGQRLSIPAGGTVSARPPATVTPTVAAQPRPTQTPVDRSPLGAKIAATAVKYLGTPYVWGGASPQTGFDCSGFVMYVYRQVGVLVPRDLWGQLNSGVRIERAALQPGDIVFFQNTYKPGLSHAGIYLGGGQFVQAAGENSGVIVSRLDSQYWAAHYLGASRPY